MFDQAFQNESIFSVVVAADFFYIERFTSSLTIYLAKLLQIKQIREINKQLFENNILLPENFARKVLYQIILQKAIKNEYNYYHNDGLKQWINRKDFIDAYPQQLIERSDFDFLYLINGRHIKYDPTNPSINSMLIYQGVSLDLNGNKNLRELMEHYLEKDDLKTSLVAGGIFSNYKNDSLFGETFPSLFNLYKDKQDVDIFIQDPSNGQVDDISLNKFKKYISNFENRGINILQICTNKGRDYSSMYALDMNKYKINCFKFKHHDGQIINLIFPSKCDFSKITDFFNTFDFSITKIYYSYESDSIYLPVEIVTPYKRMCLNLKKESDRIDVLSNIYSMEFYAMTKLVCDLLSTTNLYTRCKNHRSINSRNRSFIRESAKQLCLLRSYFAVHFRRTMKYAFKNYFLP